MPTAWFNIMPPIVQAGMQPLPPLHPGTHGPVGPAAWPRCSPRRRTCRRSSSSRGSTSPARSWTSIGSGGRPRCTEPRGWSSALGTPARTYDKYEGVSPAGSHKPNTAIAQAFYNKQAGTKRFATETGAGQWRCALAMACRFFGMDCQVFMVKASYEQKPYRLFFMETFGAEVVPSPSTHDPGRQGGARGRPGAHRVARSRDQRGRRDGRDERASIKYALGSVLGHVLLHQTVIGLQAKEQLALAEDPRAGRDHRVRGGRFVVRRSRLSVHGRPAGGHHDDAVHC